MRLSQAGGLLLLALVQPRSNALFYAGLLAALCGEAVRAWAAGHIRKGSELAREGPYAMVRHPLYFGSFVMSCGAALMCSSTSHWASSALVWGAVLLAFFWLYPKKMEMEERDLEAAFGEAFRRHRARVPAFWPDPGLWGEARASSRWTLAQALRNKEHRTLLALLGLALLLRVKMVYRL